MAGTTPERLLAAAVAATRHAHAPYSGFRVGAALLTTDGTIIGGANIESASYGLTMCAERVALFKALSEGHHEFAAMALVSPAEPPFTPCGACRQLLAEYAPEVELWIADSREPGRYFETTVAELLPRALVRLPGVGPAA